MFSLLRADNSDAMVFLKICIFVSEGMNVTC
jgi:hypothetical protein